MKTEKRILSLLLALVLLTGITPIRAEAAGQKLAAITFDDGPGPYTDNLLDELAKRNVPVTFFMVGYRAAKYPGIVQKAYEAGHQIASHTYDHPSLTKTGDKAIQKQVSVTASILNQATGGAHTYMVRPPYGNADARVLKALNVPAVLWSVDTLDWKSRNADAVYRHILNDTKDGSIILLHDIHETSIPGALRGIDALLSQGYELVTVRELLRRRGKEAVPGVKYFSAYGTSTLPGITKPAIVPTETENGRAITLTADPGAKIYYTTDGTAPTSKSAVYTGPIPLEGAGTIKAFAALDLNGARSQVSTLALEESQANAPEITMQNGTDILPERVATRRDAAEVLHRMAGFPKASPASGVSDLKETDSGYAALSWAIEQRLLRPYADGTIRPDAPITREQLAALLFRASGGTWKDEPERAMLYMFLDWETVEKDNREAVDWAVSRGLFDGLLNGLSDAMLFPRRAVTRGQLAGVITRCQENGWPAF